MAIAPRLTVTLAVVPADKPTIVALAELEAAMARLRRLADTNDQGRDACRHRAPGRSPDLDLRGARVVSSDEQRDARSDGESPLLAVGSAADLNKASIPLIKGELRLLDDGCHHRVVLRLDRGARVINASGHRSSPAVGQDPVPAGPDGGALGADTPGASGPTVGEPTDIDAGVLLSPGSVGGGSVGDAVHGASSAGFDLERFEIAWPDDSAGNPDLVCTWCDDVLCEVEQGDTILTLVTVCESHVCGPAPVVLP